ncbi:hypothetical protein, partial [Bacillus thuringiensis]|uniref:hypothetical protein n=1 Tax=Bacillus thuringiensis TaxID=1428 RepID=UPI0027D27505
MKKVLLTIPILIILLSGCSNNDIYGSWEVVDNKKGECPVYYKFETVVKKENKEEIVQNLVEMQTTKNKDDLYKGSFVKNSNVFPAPTLVQRMTGAIIFSFIGTMIFFLFLR